MSLLSMFAILLFVLVGSQISFSRSGFTESKQCTGKDNCVAIDQCPMFGPQFTNSKWSSLPIYLKQEFKLRVCERTSVNGTEPYKVCCPRGIDLLDLEGCGPVAYSKMVGGYAQLFQYPWMAVLKNRRGSFICGGTLINERYVLTAAHCLIYNIVSVRLGEFDLSSEEDCNERGTLCAPPPQDIDVERLIAHEAYSRRQKLNDIGLIRLAQKASYNDNVKPICLPVGPEMRTTQNTFFVAGWGRTKNNLYSNILKHATLSLVPIDDCQQQWIKLYPSTKLNNNQLCAISTDLDDICTGDSGGPLKSFNANGRYVQYGVVSFGLPTCGKQRAPEVFTKVENYIDWILKHLEE